jgi:hypothetical protein
MSKTRSVKGGFWRRRFLETTPNPIGLTERHIDVQSFLIKY